MKPEVRVQKIRVERALRWAQARLKTSFHFTIFPMSRESKGRDAVFYICETDRGRADRGHFNLEFHYPDVSVMGLRDLRILAGHECLHAVLWGLTQWADDYMEEGSAEQVALEELDESVTYQLQRAVFGECSR